MRITSGTLHASVHLDVSGRAFSGVDTLRFLGLFSFLLFGRFGGSSDGHVGVDFGRGGYRLRIVFSGRFEFGVKDVVSSDFRPFLGGETVEFVLCRDSSCGFFFGIGRMRGRGCDCGGEGNRRFFQDTNALRVERVELCRLSLVKFFYKVRNYSPF